LVAATINLVASQHTIQFAMAVTNHSALSSNKDEVS